MDRRSFLKASAGAGIVGGVAHAAPGAVPAPPKKAPSATPRRESSLVPRDYVDVPRACGGHSGFHPGVSRSGRDRRCSLRTGHEPQSGRGCGDLHELGGKRSEVLPDVPAEPICLPIGPGGNDGLWRRGRAYIARERDLTSFPELSRSSQRGRYRPRRRFGIKPFDDRRRRNSLKRKHDLARPCT